MTLPDRQMRAPPRTIRPSVTYEPAICVLLPTRMTWRTSARPSMTSTISGSSRPLSAASMQFQPDGPDSAASQRRRRRTDATSAMRIRHNSRQSRRKVRAHAETGESGKRKEKAVAIHIKNMKKS